MSARTFRGIPAASGVALGPAFVLRPDGDPRPPAAAGRPDAPTTPSPGIGVDEALDEVVRELTELANRLVADGHAAEADIVSVGAIIAADPVLREETAAAVGAGRRPDEAIREATERHARSMEALGDPVLSERAADIRQVGRRALAVIHAGRAESGGRAAGGVSPHNGRASRPVVVLAEELGPADVLGVGEGLVAAAAAVRGGASSHAAIVARTIGVPLVLGIDASVLDVADGTAVVVDGDEGSVTVDPSPERTSAVSALIESGARRREALAAERGLPAETTDGRRVGLLCNVATEAEAVAGLDAGAEGVGLLRTELAFLDAPAWPTEADHRRVLEPILARLRGRVAIVRVLDFGGDKVPPFLRNELPERSGPHLRGLPALLHTEDALAAQLRATLRAGSGCRLGVLVPMVTSLREVRLAKEILLTAVDEVGSEKPQVGVMVEVPSAALLADRIARDVDFLSVGTNDLTEHALGVNRRDPNALPALAAHPSVVTLINRVARAARDRGCAIRICGEAAADPLVVPLLVGAGVDSLSVSPARVDEVRARVRRLSYSACSEVLRDAIAAESIEDVWDMVRGRCWPDLP